MVAVVVGGGGSGGGGRSKWTTRADTEAQSERARLSALLRACVREWEDGSGKRKCGEVQKEQHPLCVRVCVSPEDGVGRGGGVCVLGSPALPVSVSERLWRASQCKSTERETPTALNEVCRKRNVSERRAYK